MTSTAAASSESSAQRKPRFSSHRSRRGGLSSRRANGSLSAFALIELVLAMAIPFLAIEGYHTLLESRAGTFIDEPSENEPGWRALVDHTVVTAVVDVDRLDPDADASQDEAPAQRVTGIALVVHDPPAVLLAPSSLVVDGVALAESEPTAAVQALSEALRLGIDDTLIMNTKAWRTSLADLRLTVNNPDPVVDGSGNELIPVGEVDLDAAQIAAFAGRPAPGGDAMSALPRREVLWHALLARPSEISGPLGTLLAQLADDVQVLDVPMEAAAALDDEQAELLLRETVAYPTSPPSGSRLRVTIIDRTGSADLNAIAAAVAAQGIEVPSIGNASVFDEGPTQLIIPVPLDAASNPQGIDQRLAAQLTELSASLGTATVLDNDASSESAEDAVVRLVIGSNFELANLSS